MSDQLKWYVVRAISGKEKKVKQYIDAEINRLGMTHLAPQVLIPTEKYYQMRDGKKIAKERNFFPGYVLIEAALDGRDQWLITNDHQLAIANEDALSDLEGRVTGPVAIGDLNGCGAHGGQSDQAGKRTGD